jgi:diguanylate cyclase (GGDEF)-like protein
MFQNKYSIGFKITVMYIVISTLWILFSDYLVNSLVSDPGMVIKIEVVKGWFFVAITALMLYQIISHSSRLLRESEEQLLKKNEEIMTTYEELLASEEELKQQFDELLYREEKINRRNECLYALHEASIALMQGFMVDDLLKIVVRKMMKISGAQFGYIYLLSENDNSMISKVIEGFALDQIQGRVKKGEGIIGKVWESGDVVIVPRYHEWEDRLRDPVYNLLKAGIGIPLKAEGKVIGVFSMNYTVEHVFDKEELQMLESFAELTSISLGNFLLYQALQKSQRRNQRLIDALPDSIYLLDCSGIVLSYKNGKEFTSINNQEEKFGQKLEDFLMMENPQILAEKIQQALLTEKIQFFEYQYQEMKTIRYQEVRIIAINANEIIAIVRDITQRKDMEGKLHYYALHDRMTGLYNRVYFEEKLQELDRNCQSSIGIVICDIDGLKLVNDTFGHQAGDELLISAATIIKECFSGIAEVARVGGDEFAVILYNSSSIDIEEICQCIRRRVSEFRETNTKIPLSISIGFSVKAYPKQSVADVFKVADDNMYREKLHSSQSIRSSIVKTLSKALEVRDFVDDGHIDRLEILVVKLAEAIGIESSRLPDLRLLGRFHDIGKVGIPDHILFKSSRLSDEEFIIMRRHCEIGYRMAQSSGELLPIADWILKHQEWWNGQGYPLGIKNEEIPLACRILSIADAFDAMTNDRPYRKAMNHEEAIAEIERCAGTQFDPNLVPLFKQIVAAESDKLKEVRHVIQN